MVLDNLRKIHTLLLICILHQREDNETLRRAGDVALVGGGVILLHHDNVVLSHRYIEVAVLLVKTHNVGRSTRSRSTCAVDSIDVDGDEEVGSRIVGNLATVVQCYINICRAGIDDLHVWIVLVNHLAERESHVECNVLFVVFSVHRAGVFSAVSCIENDGFYLACALHGLAEYQIGN